MALIKLGNAVQDARGSLNGTTFSRNKGGAYMRTKVSPVQPNTVKQLAVRAAFAANTKLWSGTMTAAQRATWVSYAATYPYVNVFGDASVLTGLSMSVAKNQVLNQIGVSSILTAPVDNSVAGIPVPTSLTASHTGAGISIATTAQAAAADTDYYVFMTGPLAAGINPNENRFRFVGAFAPVAAAVVIGVGSALYTKWEAIYGALGTGNVGNIVWAVVAQVSISKGNITVGQKVSGVVS